jgi:hypothetical protein
LSILFQSPKALALSMMFHQCQVFFFTFGGRRAGALWRGKKCNKRGNFICLLILYGFLCGGKGEQLLQHKFKICLFFLIYGSKISMRCMLNLLGHRDVAPLTYQRMICNQPLTVTLTGIK